MSDLRFPDPIDQAAELSSQANEARVAEARKRSAPEQVQNADGSWPQTECEECGDDLGPRLELGYIRCVSCQQLRELKLKRMRK